MSAETFSVDAPQKDTEALGVTDTNRFERLFSFAAQDARQVEADAGCHIHETSTAAESVYFIHIGQVRIFQLGADSQLRLVEILGPNDWFGAAALAHAPTCGTRAVAFMRTILSEIPAQRWHAALAATPDVAAELIGELARKLQASQEDAGRLAFDDCNQRLLKTLLQFSQSAAASRCEDTGETILNLSQRQLAQAIGATRETISLAIGQLRQRDLLRTGRNQLFFNPDVLRKVCRRAKSARMPTKSHEIRERVA